MLQSDWQKKQSLSMHASGRLTEVVKLQPRAHIDSKVTPCRQKCANHLHGHGQEKGKNRAEGSGRGLHV